MSPSLYIHIPFCLKRCIYCDFVSGLYNPAKADAYIDTLIKELYRISPSPSPASGEGITTLYIGGGTPTALSTEKLKQLLNHIFGHFTFTGNYEATIEANPGTLDLEKLRAIRSSGINRISLGVQSFNNDELSFLGRIHNGEDAEQALYLAREAGFENIGIDLMYGLPQQDINIWKDTLQRAVRLKPDHVSAYELTVEKGTVLYDYLKNPPSSPFEKGGNLFPLDRGDKGVCPPLWQRGARGDFSTKLNMPDEDKIIEMYEYAIDYLTSEGYLHYEISNFALPGNQCRHNLNYWDRGEYYGAGLGAHSFIKAKRFHNTDNLDEYLRLISEDRSPVKETECITEEMAVSEAIFLGLRKTSGLTLESFSRQYRINLLSSYQNEINELKEAGLIEITASGCSYETNIRLTKKGLSLSNEVFKKFI